MTVRELLAQWGLDSRFDPNADVDPNYGADPLGLTGDGGWSQQLALERRAQLAAAMADERAAANPYSALTSFGPIWGQRPDLSGVAGDMYFTPPANPTVMEQAGMVEQIARQLNIDPQVAIQSYQNAMTSPDTSLFAGATDVNNMNLRPGWAIADMLQRTGNYTPDYANWLAQWVDQGNVAKDEQNARDKANFNKSLMSFGAGLASLAIPGFMGAFNSFNPLGVAYDAAADLGIGAAQNAAGSALGSGLRLNGGGLGFNPAEATGFWSQSSPTTVFGSDAAAAFGTTGGSSGGFFSDILDTAGDIGTGFQNTGRPSLGLNPSAPMGSSLAETAQGTGFWEGLTGTGVNGTTGFWSGVAPSVDGFTSALGNLFPTATKTLGSLLGGTLSGGGNLFGGGTDLLKSLGGLAGSAISAAPIVGALGYAASQDPFDTSRLESLYNQYSPQANTFEFDMNTGRGRQRLTSNLARRGVLGSSFGNMDLNSFDTLRELGRSALINQGVGTSAGLANSILDAQIKGRQQKNDLYGRALLALGGAIGGRTGVNV